MVLIEKKGVKDGTEGERRKRGRGRWIKEEMEREGGKELGREEERKEEREKKKR